MRRPLFELREADSKVTIHTQLKAHDILLGNRNTDAHTGQFIFVEK